MFKNTLFLQWRATRGPVVLLATLCAALPFVAVKGGPALDATLVSEAARVLALLQWASLATVLFPVAAGLTGAWMALAVWTWDHEEGHVYALSLPFSRGRYAVLKWGAGLVLAMIPVVTLGLSSMVALMVTDLPAVLHGYAGALTLRFGLAVVMAYAVLFAMAAGTKRTALRVSGAVVAVFLIAAVAGPQVVTLARPDLADVNVVAWLADGLVEWPTPFRVFTGSWMLIDV